MIGTQKAAHILSSDHFVRSRQHIRRNRQADLLSRFQIDDELELRRLLHGQIGRVILRSAKRVDQRLKEQKQNFADV